MNTSLVPLKHGFFVNGNLTIESVDVNLSTIADVPVAPSTTKKKDADLFAGGFLILTVSGARSE